MKITYDPNNGITCRDGELAKVAADIIAAGEDCTVSNELLITQIRVFIRRGLVKPENIIFLYQEYELCPDKNGRLQDWPEGFCDHNAEMLSEMLLNCYQKCY